MNAHVDEWKRYEARVWLEARRRNVLLGGVSWDPASVDVAATVAAERARLAKTSNVAPLRRKA